MCFGEFVVFKGKNLYTLSEGRIIESFQQLLSDLTPLTYGSYFCELIDIAMVDEESNKDLFQYFVSALYIMKTGASDYEILARAFELKLLRMTGYGMVFDNCCSCRKKISNSNYLNLQYYGWVCADCEKVNGIYVNRSVYSAMKFLDTVPLDKVYRVSLSKEVKDEIYRAISMLISGNYSRKPKSLQMLDIFKGE